MKKFKTTALTIIIGIISSALWELFRPYFTFIFENTVLHLIHFFSDSFYISVSKSIDAPQSMTYYFILLFVGFSFLFSVKDTYDWYHDNSQKYKFILRGAIFGICVFYALSGAIKNQIARSTLRDIEIVAPYISDSEYKTLKSDFYRMSSKNDYSNLVERIDAIMDENNLSE